MVPARQTLEPSILKCIVRGFYPRGLGDEKMGNPMTALINTVLQWVDYCMGPMSSDRALSRFKSSRRFRPPNGAALQLRIMPNEFRSTPDTITEESGGWFDSRAEEKGSDIRSGSGRRSSCL
jgi:hypothetical protein